MDEPRRRSPQDPDADARPHPGSDEETRKDPKKDYEERVNRTLPTPQQPDRPHDGPAEGRPDVGG